jgi:LEA14-like dessication related protein
MRTIALSMLIAMLVAGSSAIAEQVPAPKIVVKEMRYDAGKVKQGTQVIHLFEITNAGTAPLVIERVQPS